MKVIINADDFGITMPVTQAIEKCIEDQVVSSTTVMANGDSLEEAKRFADLHTEASFGIHYCLSEFTSLTKSQVFVKYGITDSEGYFIKKAIIGVKNISNDLSEAIFLELCAQTEYLLNMGFKLSHADSHHHVHTLPQLQPIFIKVLQKYGIRKVRLQSPYRFFSACRNPISWYKHMRLNYVYKRMFDTADVFYSYLKFTKKPHLFSHVELMCHPGHPGTIYKKEMGLVDTCELKKHIKFELISYNDL